VTVQGEDPAGAHRPRSSPGNASADPWADVVDQDGVIQQLEAASHAPVHAYLLLGPPGVGKRALARGFAARLLAAGQRQDGANPRDTERHVRLARRERHPDLRVVVPEGLTFRRSDAESLVRHATHAPIEASRKVVVALGCEAMEDEAAGYLLKAVEEPSASTVFVLVATEVVPELTTIASRCVTIEVPPLPIDDIATHLEHEGVDPDVAARCALAAGGDLERARTLATDERLSARHRAWSDVPHRLDGTGYAAATLVAELGAMIDEALAPLRERHSDEAAALTAQIEEFGLRAGSARREMENRHKREMRRFRTAELRFGLATLAGAYRDRLAGDGGVAVRPAELMDALERIDTTAVALTRYPNETLQLQALFAHLPPLREHQ
jgi:DNA polymerase III subunit delta'